MSENDGNKHTISSRNEGSGPLKDCERRFTVLEGKVNTVNNALFGPDGTNGLVKTVDRIEYQTGLIRFFGQGLFGIAVSIITLILMNWWKL